jgi:hypothetical protein
MKPLFALVVVGLVIQGGPQRRAAPDTLTKPCVPTEPMPIAGLHGRPPEPAMPVVRPDSTWRSRMPIIKLIPCYLVDSLRPH